MNSEFPPPGEEVKRLANEIEALRGDMQMAFRKLTQMEKRLRSVFPSLPKRPKSLPSQQRPHPASPTPSYRPTFKAS